MKQPNDTKNVDTGSALLNGEHKEDAASDEALFDSLLEKIGSYGIFQKRFNLIFNFLFIPLMVMPHFNIVQALSVPEHHCHIPGRSGTNYTLEEWQQLHIPLEKDPKTGKEALSSCKMYNITTLDIYSNTSGVVDCQYGWDYDKQWFLSTVPSDRDWVCDQELNIPNTFAAGRVGDMLGLFVFGQLADRLGRKPLFYGTVALLVTGRLLSIWTSSIYILFLATVFLANSSSVLIFQNPIVICLEMSRESKRSHIAFTQTLAWTTGCCLLPLVYWAIGDWQWMFILTTVPAIIPFFCYKLMIESPRWLASQGRTKDAKRVLGKIAKVNGARLPENTIEVLNKIGKKKDTTYGILSLFSNRRIAMNTFLIVTCWGACSLSYYALLLNISNMAGNPFMNYFWQALVELPGCIGGRILSDKIGRRWTHTGCYIGSLIFSGAVILTHGSAPWVTTLFVTCVKLSFTVIFYMVWLQGMEVYPTCLRQTGLAMCGIVSNAVGILGPYVVYLGTSVDGRLPYAILFGLGVVGTVCSVLLPETLNKKLPETLEDTRKFGRDQKFWSLNTTKSIR